MSLRLFGFRWFSIFTITIFLTGLAQAEGLRRLYYKGQSISTNHRSEVARSRVKIELATLNDRRFVITTPDGHRVVARKLNTLGKLSSVRSSGSRVNVRAFSGTIRIGGRFDKSQIFAMSVVGSDNPAIHAVFHQVDDSYVLAKGDGSQIISKVHTPNLPQCGGAPEGNAAHDAHDEASAGSGASGSAADGSVQVDVAILFSPEAVAASGDLNSAIAEANTAITTANQTYNNSQISQQLSLAYAGATATSESGSYDTDLNRITTPSDGFFDEAQTVREAYGADLVSLFVVNSQYCGLAWLMTTVSSAFDDYGYSVVSRDCASANFSFPHELGHNMGANHDLANAGGSGAYSYSYGWRFTGTNAVQYRSVMAYAPGTRIGYFSNPDVSYQGTATGTSSANNALTLNNTASTVAGFRATGTSPTPTPTGQNPPPPTATPTSQPLLTRLTKTTTSTSCVAAGTVVDATDAHKLSGQTVYLVKSTGRVYKTTRTSSRGKFTLKGKLNTSYYVLAGESLSRTFKCKSSR